MRQGYPGVIESIWVLGLIPGAGFVAQRPVAVNDLRSPLARRETEADAVSITLPPERIRTVNWSE